jgi:AcrR family transcriptional regulator
MSAGSEPVWAREKQARRPALSRDIIVDAGIRIADAEGVEAVSIRRVAADLGVRPMSLYTHIEHKEDLLTLMRDRVNAEVLLGDDLPADWRVALTTIARRTRDVVLRHRWMIDVHDMALGPNALRHLEESLIAVRPLTADPVIATHVLFAVDRFVMGHVSSSLTRHDDIMANEMTGAYLERLLASGEFEELARAIAAGALFAGEASPDPVFERGLAWLLDGIEADVVG